MADTTIGRYEIKHELGRGGMAIAYLAIDPYMKRDVVVKVMAGRVISDPEFHDRFEREAQVIAGLEHPCVVPVYDFGYHEEHPYLVMRHMSGGTLADQIVREKQMGLVAVSGVIERIASALDAVHEKGLVHRDLKPGNILLDQNGDSFLADFGLIKLMGTTGKLSGEYVLGTPAYMSPEMIHGKEDIDRRADVYALGVVLYEMLTGHTPYQNSDATRVMMAHVMEPIPMILEERPDLAPAIGSVINDSLAKDPVERYQTAGELAAGLIGASRGIPSRRARRRMTTETIDSVLDSLEKKGKDEKKS